MRGIEQKTTLEQKLEKLRLICERSPDNSIGLLALAETAFRRGLRLEALEAYQKVLKDESVAEAHLCMAQMYRHHGLSQEAISELRTLFEIEPGYPEAHVFARELATETTLPADIEDVLVAGCGNDELALARVRLSIARSLVLREGQELVAIQDANAGDPTFGYYIGETRKRLSYCEEVLSQLAALEEARRAYLADQDRQRQIERERQMADNAPPRATPVVPIDADVLQGPADEGLVGVSADSPGDFSDDDYEDDSELEAPVAEPDEEYADAGHGLSQAVAPEEESVSDELPVDEEPRPVFQPSPLLYEDPPEGVPAPEPQLVLVAAVADPEPPAPAPTPTLLLPAVEEPVAQVAPALWDDPPRVAAPPPILAVQSTHHEEVTLDLTPTLVGDLPEPATPGALWDDGPMDNNPGPTLSLGLSLETNHHSDLGDDLAMPAHRPEPVDETPAPALAVVQTTPPAPAAPDYSQVYEPLLGALDGLIQTLAKTRSVSSVFLINREGYAIAEQVKDSLTKERLTEFVVETVSFLEAFSSAPQYWVLECAGGIVVIQSVDGYHFLVIIGQTGANFGALRYTMDRVRPNFEQVLQPACRPRG